MDRCRGRAVFRVGDARRMAKDVDATLRKIVQEHGGKTVDQANEYVEKLKSEKRYKRDKPLFVKSFTFTNFRSTAKPFVIFSVYGIVSLQLFPATKENSLGPNTIQRFLAFARNDKDRTLCTKTLNSH